MHKSILFRKILPLIFSYILVLISAIIIDYLLHIVDLSWVGRYFGFAGTFLILLSFIYSMRKRKIIQTGTPGRLLKLHEHASWLGAVLLLVHAGVHFNALLPWLAIFAMMVVVASGHVGKYLLKISREELNRKKSLYREQVLDDTEVEKKLFWDSLAVDLMTRWRTIHVPVVIFFISLAMLHILSIFFFWNWK